MKLSKAELRFEEWMKYADEDQRMVEIALKEDGPPNQICFHSQQVAEKYLKGYLVFSGKEFEKNHLLRYLLELCGEVDPKFRDLDDDVIYLTQFYIETRYPGDIPEFNLPECQKAFEAALRIKEFVLKKIGSSAENGFGVLGIVALFAAILLLVGGGYFAYQRFIKPADTGGTACTQEAKLCPDGSSVSRTGPNCEFAKCPGDDGTSAPQPIDTSAWKTYRNAQYGFEFKYPPYWDVADDLDGVGQIARLGESENFHFSVEYQENPDGKNAREIYRDIFDTSRWRDVTIDRLGVVRSGERMQAGFRADSVFLNRDGKLIIFTGWLTHSDPTLLSSLEKIFDSLSFF